MLNPFKRLITLFENFTKGPGAPAPPKPKPIKNVTYITIELHTRLSLEPDELGNDFIWQWHPVAPKRISGKQRAVVAAKVTRICLNEIMPAVKDAGSKTQRMVISVPEY